jgi:hypothetical protein
MSRARARPISKFFASQVLPTQEQIGKLQERRINMAPIRKGIFVWDMDRKIESLRASLKDCKSEWWKGKLFLYVNLITTFPSIYILSLTHYTPNSTSILFFHVVSNAHAFILGWFETHTSAYGIEPFQPSSGQRFIASSSRHLGFIWQCMG